MKVFGMVLLVVGIGTTALTFMALADMRHKDYYLRDVAKGAFQFAAPVSVALLLTAWKLLK